MSVRQVSTSLWTAKAQKIIRDAFPDDFVGTGACVRIYGHKFNKENAGRSCRRFLMPQNRFLFFPVLNIEKKDM